MHPHSRETLATTRAGWGTTIEEIPLADGVTDAEALGARSATTSPRSSCSTRTSSARSRTSRRSRRPPARRARSLIVQCDPITLGILRPTGDFGVDIAVGEGQPLGNRLDFGGPSFGFFAAERGLPAPDAGAHRRRDDRRRRPPRLRAHAADARAAHPPREGDHNICTAQALNALAGVVYLSWLGSAGIVELGELMLRRTAYAREALAAIDGVERAARAAGRARVRRHARRAGRRA